jgi:hypothetical protein
MKPCKYVHIVEVTAHWDVGDLEMREREERVNVGTAIMMRSNKKGGTGTRPIPF